MQKLDEVIVKSKLTENRQRKDKLSSNRFGKVVVIDDEERKATPTLTNFLISKGLFVEEDNSVPTAEDMINSGSTFSAGLKVYSSYGRMNIYLDDVQLYDTSILIRLDLSQIDYVEINKTGVGEGLRGAGATGVLRIYSNKNFSNTINKKTTKEYQIPLTFSAEKKYYVPKYRNTGDSFYKSYGVVDWKPHLNIDESGNVSIKISRHGIPITLFIEGIANDGSFIVDEKTISLN